MPTPNKSWSRLTFPPLRLASPLTMTVVSNEAMKAKATTKPNMAPASSSTCGDQWGNCGRNSCQS